MGSTQYNNRRTYNRNWEITDYNYIFNQFVLFFRRAYTYKFQSNSLRTYKNVNIIGDYKRVKGELPQREFMVAFGPIIRDV